MMLRWSEMANRAIELLEEIAGLLRELRDRERV